MLARKKNGDPRINATSLEQALAKFAHRVTRTSTIDLLAGKHFQSDSSKRRKWQRESLQTQPDMTIKQADEALKNSEMTEKSLNIECPLRANMSEVISKYQETLNLILSESSGS